MPLFSPTYGISPKDSNLTHTCENKNKDGSAHIEIRKYAVLRRDSTEVLERSERSQSQGDEAKLRTNDQEMPLSATLECENRNVVHGSDRRRNRSIYPVPPWLVRVLF